MNERMVERYYEQTILLSILQMILQVSNDTTYDRMILPANEQTILRTNER
jgi:hypothetical protein